jgi:hypothetical protein
MTTVRQQLEVLGEVLKKSAGQVPLCCYEVRADGKIRCEWISRWLDSEEFRRECLKCQRHMLNTVLKNL